MVSGKSHVVVITYPNSPWLSGCISSLQGCNYPIHVCVNPEENCPYDAGGFYYAEKHGLEEFIPLHDSIIVKDVSIFDKVFNLEGNVALADRFLMSFGKFNLKSIQPLAVKPKNKKEALDFEIWTMKITPDHKISPLKDTDEFTTIHGQKRMVLENEYFIKYKGTWNSITLDQYKE